MTATAVIGLGCNRPRRIAAKLRADDGVGLVELLIALLVLNIGIFATMAAFTGGALALRRASHVSAASAVADHWMEKFRNLPFASIPPQTGPSSPCTSVSIPTSVLPPNFNGPDGRTYDLSGSASWCSQLASGTSPGSTSVKTVTLTVNDPADGNKLLVTTSSTFSQCAQDMTSQTCQS